MNKTQFSVFDSAQNPSLSFTDLTSVCSPDCYWTTLLTRHFNLSGQTAVLLLSMQTSRSYAAPASSSQGILLVTGANRCTFCFQALVYSAIYAKPTSQNSNLGRTHIIQPNYEQNPLPSFPFGAEPISQIPSFSPVWSPDC